MGITRVETITYIIFEHMFCGLKALDNQTFGAII